MKKTFKSNVAFVIVVVFILSNLLMVCTFADEYTLQQNEVVSDYKNPYGNYNCYAFAIGRGEDEKQYNLLNRWYLPGDISGTYCDIQTATIQQIAMAVGGDLQAMGYSVVSSGFDQLPAGFDPYNPNPNQQLICFRLGNYPSGWKDIHFMRYDVATQSWYHKPADSTILKYNCTDNDDNAGALLDPSTAWIGEYASYDGSGVSMGNNGIVYTETIGYILYDTNSIEIDSSAAVEKIIKLNKDIFCRIDIAETATYDLKISSSYAFNYELYKVNHTSQTGNIEKIKFEAGETFVSNNLTFTPGIYFLRIEFYGDLSGLPNPNQKVSVWIHSHSFGGWESLDNTSHERTCTCGLSEFQTHAYGRWMYYNNFLHKKTCTCGYFTTESHYVRRSDIVDGRYANCLGCLRRLDLNTDNAGIVMGNVVKVSTNGSYILASGIVVLVDTDIEAYLAGTLEFYDRANMPPTSNI